MTIQAALLRLPADECGLGGAALAREVRRGGQASGIRASYHATLARSRLEQRPITLRETQRVGQEAHRLASGCLPRAALQIANAFGAESGFLSAARAS